MLLLVAAGVGQRTTRASVNSLGRQGNGGSYGATLSGDGRLVAFRSDASNLVAGDTNGALDVFVHDRRTGETTRVSVDDEGAQGNRDSGGPAFSDGGQVIAFWSDASNLVVGDTNGRRDVFVHDRPSGTTTRVSVSSSEAQANRNSRAAALSADGRVVAFRSDASTLVAGDTNGTGDIFIHERETGKTERVSVGRNGRQSNGRSRDPSLSADGRVVAFRSDASNLVARDTNGAGDIFVHDRRTGLTARVSVGRGGTQATGCTITGCGCDPALSADGRFVAFWSSASDLVAGDTNGTWDVFVHDRRIGQTTRVSVGLLGTQGNGASGEPPLSGNGRFVAFTSAASNLVTGDTNGTWDVFVHDRRTGLTTSATVGARQGSGLSADPALSGDGRYLAFHSLASNLVARDTNRAADIFVRRR